MERTPTKFHFSAPELVVEVMTPGNRKPEINHKIQGFLGSGVKEVILVGLTGVTEYIRQAEHNVGHQLKIFRLGRVFSRNPAEACAESGKGRLYLLNFNNQKSRSSEPKIRCLIIRNQEQMSWPPEVSIFDIYD